MEYADNLPYLFLLFPIIGEIFSCFPKNHSDSRPDMADPYCIRMDKKSKHKHWTRDGLIQLLDNLPVIGVLLFLWRNA